MTLVQPTPEQQLHIRTELNEDVSTRDSDLMHIKEWLARQPHLPNWDGKIFSLYPFFSYCFFVFLLSSFNVLLSALLLLFY